MLTKYIYTLILPVVPIAAALVCLLMMMLIRSNEEPCRGTSPHERRVLKRILLLFYFCEIAMWISTLCYNYVPASFVHLSAAFYLVILLTQVSFFHFVYRLTQQRADEVFSFWHYLLPLLIAGLQEVWMLCVPFDVTLGLVESKGIPSAEYPVYSVYFLFKIKMRMIYSLFYTVWALIRIYRYRQAVVNYSSDEERMSLSWLKVLVFLALVLVLLPLSMVFRERSYVFTAMFLMPFMVVLLLAQFVLLCYNFITGNYVQISLAGRSVKGVKDVKGSYASLPLSREQFENYIHLCKPYLNTQLRITDLAAALGTNRSYLSAFINTTYHMNFSQLINGYRMEEFRRLEKEKPELGKAERAVAAGFGSYRSYARIVKS